MNLTKNIITNIIKYILLTIIIWIICNWIFVWFFWSKIRESPKLISLAILLISIIIRPIIYIRNIKSMVTTDLIKYILYNYKDEFVDQSSIYITNRWISQYNQTKANPTITKVTSIIQNNSWIINRIISYISWTSDIIEKINNLTSQVDRSNPDQSQIQNLIKTKLKSDEYLPKPDISWWFVYIFLLNLWFIVLCLLWFYQNELLTYAKNI